ncbi:MAG: NUDIX hydrolase [Pseudomonadota bacterium]
MPELSGKITEHSAGGVLWRPDQDDSGNQEICLIATRGRTRWQLPKGHISEGETEDQAAQREVREETGCLGDVECDLGEIVYWFFAGKGDARRRVRKSVRFFLIRYRSGNTSDHDTEVDDACWLPAQRARDMITFSSERNVLDAALRKIRSVSRGVDDD